MKMNKNWTRLWLLVISLFVLIGLSAQLQAQGEESSLDESAVLEGDYDEGVSFLRQFVIEGGPIVWFVLMPLSFYSCYQAIDLSIKTSRKILLPQENTEQLKKIAEKGDKEVIKSAAAKQDDLLSYSLSRAFNLVKTKEVGYMGLQQMISDVLQERTLEILRKVERLNLTGNISPMVGLFGTVFGMIKSFNTIVEAGGQPDASQLAGGISVALVTTFWGLFVAIPSLFIYGYLRNKLEAMASEAAVEAETVLDKIEDIY
ncbi:Biopolymer transport protein ExbB [Sedimentisphaera salicampi]|uniref:Biopolymer transport protein ExbB n=2 Tax=Sedimentisphaera salicampi TaxID=1941349 RepID=A0A1W6LP02_9BACT|nr:Biopolymer transport protein ExbB [Sedimentisphaera salicampi]OXU14382.1 Biopolymer transport protein ExbB [Sedimentisphaera salicampi]